MPNVARGTTHDWPAYTRNGSGTLTDPTELQVEVLDANDVVQAGFPQDLSGTIVHDATGQYHVPWAIPPNQLAGVYHANWTGVLDGGPISGTDEITVVLPGSVNVESSGGSSYLTPERLKTQRGVSWVGWSDLELAELISEAGAEIHAYCNVPLEGQFSFLGGQVTEEHTWRLPDHPFDGGQTRIYPRVWPVVEVLEVSMQLSSNTYQPIPIDAFVKNDVERWIELSALVLTPGVFGISFFVFPLVALNRPILRVTMTHGRTWERTERMYPVAEGSLTYQAPDGFWTSSTVTISDDDTIVDPGDYAVDAPSGQVTFVNPPVGRVSASYSTFLARDIAKASSIICNYVAARLGGPGRLLLGGATNVKVGEISISRTVPRGIVGGGDVIEDLAHDVPAAARLLNAYRFWRIAS